MNLHELSAANTMFAPKKTRTQSALHTFLQTKRDETPAHSDLGEHVGARVKCKFRGKWIKGTVVATSCSQGKQEWTVRFDDNYTTKFRKRRLKQCLIHVEKEKIGRQLDYILVSTRWRSNITSCEPKWGPAIHRDIHGERNDHALVECKWKWRLRVTKQKECKDYGCLYSVHTDTDGNPIPNPKMQEFEKTIMQQLLELEYNAETDSATAIYDKMCTAISFAVDAVVPTRTQGQGVHREVSDRTKALFEQRTRLCKKGTAAQFKSIQAKIKESSLADFEAWVQRCAEEMSKAAGHGDMRAVYKGVNTLAQKQAKPPSNINTDEQGNTLKCAEDTAAVWHRFLSKKFAATTAEQGRPEMEPLPCTQGQDDLTEKQFNAGLSKMNTNKACGHDNIPTELFKRCPTCKKILLQLLQKIWSTEEVSVKFARATFTMLYKNKGSTNDPRKYRCIGLLTHAYKVMSQRLLARLETETAQYLSDWQAGFRKRRGYRDNVLTLRVIYDQMLEQGQTLYSTFIDYSAAFDSVSHKYLDKALKAAGASNKSRGSKSADYAYVSADDFSQLVFSIHVASAIIETFFSKNKYIKSRSRMSMSDSNAGNVLQLSQVPTPENVEQLPTSAVSIDVTSASRREENDLNALRNKYVGRNVSRSFDVEGVTVQYKGVIESVCWEHDIRKFLFFVSYADDDAEELELWQVRNSVL